MVNRSTILGVYGRKMCKAYTVDRIYLGFTSVPWKGGNGHLSHECARRICSLDLPVLLAYEAFEAFEAFEVHLI